MSQAAVGNEHGYGTDLSIADEICQRTINLTFYAYGTMCSTKSEMGVINESGERFTWRQAVDVKGGVKDCLFDMSLEVCRCSRTWVQ